MKKKIFIAGGIIVLLLISVTIGLVLFLNNKTALKSTLITEQGSVMIKLKDSSSYTEITTSEIKFESGAFIKTSEKSYARIFLPDNSLISLDESTETQINFENNIIDIQQLIGKTWNRVQTVTNGGEFKVQTPNTIAAVRGTIFGVGVDDKNHSRVFVEESVVEVSKYENQENPKILEKIDLTNDEIARVTKDEESFRIVKDKLDQEFKDSFWYKRNKILDDEYNKIKDLKGVDLINLLQNNLLKLNNFKEYKFAKEQDNTSLAGIEKDIEDVYNLASITEKTCTDNTPEQIQSALDKVVKYSSRINRYSQIIDLLTKLKEICTDREMNPAEADQLQFLIKKINE